MASAAGLPLAGALNGPAPRRIVVAGGHPGDPEYGCGGTVARYADLGHKVTLLYLNRGEKGCAGTAAGECGALRTAEARRACGILNSRAVFAGQIDGEAMVDGAHYDAFRLILEAEQPDIVFTHWPIDGHRDHRAMSTLVYDAWRRMERKFALFYYEVSTGEDTVMFPPMEYVDVTAVESRKRSACYAHASQTPDRYYALQSEVMRFRGIESGCKLAEAFVRHVGNTSSLLQQ